MYPFVAPPEVDEHLIARLAAAVESMTAFDCQLERTQWFGDDVLWLDPQPAERFDRLTTAVWKAFPAHPPYGGAHHTVIPHLTVAHRGPADLAALRLAEQDIQPQLPISAHIDQALLIAGSPAPNSWRTLSALPLGALAAGEDQPPRSGESSGAGVDAS